MSPPTDPPLRQPDLPRKLGLFDAAAIVVGIVIGSGIFVLPNLIAKDLPSGPAILAVWIVSGVLSFFGALAYAELGAMMPETGGQYVYLRDAIVFGGLWTSLLILTDSYETLYSYTILAAWIFYTLTVAAVYVLRRKRPDLPRPYRIWGFPYTVWLFVAVSVWFMLNALVTAPLPSVMGFVIVILGAVAYRVWRRPAVSSRRE